MSSRHSPNRIRVGVVHPGTQHSWQTASALQELRNLSWFATSIFYVADRWPYNALNFLPRPYRSRVHRELMRFYHPSLDPSFVHTFGTSQWLMRMASRAGWKRTANFFMRLNDKSIAVPVDRLMRERPIDVVWAYDLSALEVFQAAKKRGIKCILDRTIGHPSVYNAVMTPVYDEFREFFTTPDFRIPDRIIERADLEHDLADQILVGSGFCEKTLKETLTSNFHDRIHVVPYCFDKRFEGVKNRVERESVGPIRFLFLGQAAPRKGIHLVLKAFEKVPASAATLQIVGDLQIPRATFARYSDRVEYTATVPRAEVPELMQQADCLLFPSYFEGAALSIAEAQAVGLKVIQSRNTGMVADNSDPLVLADLTVDSVYRMMMKVIEAPELLSSSPTKSDAPNQYSFSQYRDRVRRVIQNV